MMAEPTLELDGEVVVKDGSSLSSDLLGIASQYLLCLFMPFIIGISIIRGDP